MEEPDYITQTPVEFLPQLSEQERCWIGEQFDSFRFRRAREEYVATYGALKLERNIDKRPQILRRWKEFLASLGKDGRVTTRSTATLGERRCASSRTLGGQKADEVWGAR
jgi:hypothetical protein